MCDSLLSLFLFGIARRNVRYGLFPFFSFFFLFSWYRVALSIRSYLYAVVVIIIHLNLAIKTVYDPHNWLNHHKHLVHVQVVHACMYPRHRIMYITHLYTLPLHTFLYYITPHAGLYHIYLLIVQLNNHNNNDNNITRYHSFHWKVYLDKYTLSICTIVFCDFAQ